MAGAEPWNDRPSLCEVLDRVLHKGVVAVGEVVISLADIELVWISLHLSVASVDTARQLKLTLAPSAVSLQPTAGDRP